MTYFKRGTVYLALGKARFALGDFSRVLDLKPDFTAARIQRGSVHLKLGEYENALIDLGQVLHEEPYNDDVNYMYSKLEPAEEQWQLVQDVMHRGDFRTAISLLTQLLELSPWSTIYREARAHCYIEEGDVLSAVSDLRSVNRLSQDSTAGYFRLATLLYKLGHSADALKEIRECLKLDPEHKDCFPFYKKLKKVEKSITDANDALSNRDYSECIRAAEKVLKLETNINMVKFTAKQLLCTCYVKDEQYASGISKCREALELHKDAGTLCDRADAYLETEMYDDGK